MKRGITVLIIVLIMSAAWYKLAYHFFPNYVYYKFEQKVKDNRRENEFSVLNTPDEDSRLVVKPNPDFAYGSAFYNLKKGPINIIGDMPDSTYWSVAFYQPNTINFYVKNDLQYGKSELDIVLTSSYIKGNKKEQILAPTKKGFLLIRLLITDRNSKDQIHLVRHLENLRIDQL